MGNIKGQSHAIEKNFDFFLINKVFENKQKWNHRSVGTSLDSVKVILIFFLPPAPRGRSYRIRHTGTEATV